MNCVKHDKDFIGNCTWCGKQLCPRCVATNTGRKIYCQACAAKVKNPVADEGDFLNDYISKLKTQGFSKGSTPQPSRPATAPARPSQVSLVRPVTGAQPARPMPSSAPGRAANPASAGTQTRPVQANPSGAPNTRAASSAFNMLLDNVAKQKSEAPRKAEPKPAAQATNPPQLKNEGIGKKAAASALGFLAEEAKKTKEKNK
ncbi:hypothetical protein J4475_03120 [Candidatus Woesearchaeota archaeon]|nr:hypothetical protein [Candidatus Woesearchaeota archaeon]